MPTPVLLPRQGNSVETCVIVRWLKKAGEPVREGEPIVEVETDKATVEVESACAGTAEDPLGHNGTSVEIHQADR